MALQATYDFNVLPIGERRALADIGGVGISFSLFSALTFATTESEEAISRDFIERALRANPFWQASPALSLQVRLPDGSMLTSQTVTSSGASAETTLGLLLRFLTGDARQARRSQAIVWNVVHDPDFDRLGADRILSVTNLYRRCVSARRSLAIAYASHHAQKLSGAYGAFGEGHSKPTQRASQQLAAAYLSLLHASLTGRPGTFRPPGPEMHGVNASVPLLAGALGRRMTNDIEAALRTELPRFLSLIRGEDTVGLRGDDGAVIGEDEMRKRLGASDPNILLSVAAREPLLAARLGLVTSWMAHFPESAVRQLESAVDLRIAWSTASPSADVVLNPARFSAARLQHRYLHPRARDASNANGILSALNGTDGQPRYRISFVNTDHEIVKAWLLQENDGSSEQMPSQGASEPTTAGVVFECPESELAAPSAPSDTLYLEDLSLGYRVDIECDSSRFLSLHEQQVGITFDRASSPADAAPPDLDGDIEAFADREQLQTNKFVPTEFTVWNGQSTVSPLPWSLPAETGSETPVDAPFRRTVAQRPNTLPRLRYGRQYHYRVRPVLQGCVSATPMQADAFLRQLSVSERARVVQEFTFPRIDSYHSGVLVPVGADNRAAKDDKPPETEIYLSSERLRPRRHTFWLAPKPLSIEQVMLHGLLGNTGDEAVRYRDVYVAQNLRRLLDGVRPGRWPRYFCEPDVNSVRLVVLILGRNPSQPQRLHRTEEGLFELVDNTIEADVPLQFGKPGDWQTFRPIHFELIASGASKAGVRVRTSESRGTRVHIAVPPGALWELVLTPIVSSAQLRTTLPAVEAAEMLGTTEGLDAGVAALVLNEQHIKVAHVVGRPALQPGCSELRIERREHESTGHLRGVLEIDAVTTERVQVDATWVDTDDLVSQPRPIQRAKTASAPPRSVRLDELPLTSTRVASLNALSAALMRGGTAGVSPWGTYAAENLVEYTGIPASTTPPQTAGSLDFHDGRRRIVSVRCRAAVRYRDPAGAKAPRSKTADLESDSITLDLPNTMAPPPVSIERVMPIARVREGARETDGRRSVGAEFALRIYVNRPWLATGPGERLAIACAPIDTLATQISNSRTSHWGEDIFARGRFAPSRRRPTARDFGTTSSATSSAAAIEYYAESAIPREEADALLASLASYDLTYDEEAQLWECDVTVNRAFSGWLTLALYRHQPHSVGMQHLSRMPTWAYARQLETELFTYLRRAGYLEVRSGPIYDRHVSFDIVEGQLSDDGVLLGCSVRTVLQAYEIDGARHFYARVLEERSTLILRKHRLGQPCGAWPLP